MDFVRAICLIRSPVTNVNTIPVIVKIPIATALLSERNNINCSITDEYSTYRNILLLSFIAKIVVININEYTNNLTNFANSLPINKGEMKMNINILINKCVDRGVLSKNLIIKQRYVFFVLMNLNLIYQHFFVLGIVNGLPIFCIFTLEIIHQNEKILFIYSIICFY